VIASRVRPLSLKPLRGDPAKAIPSPAGFLLWLAYGNQFPALRRPCDERHAGPLIVIVRRLRLRLGAGAGFVALSCALSSFRPDVRSAFNPLRAGLRAPAHIQRATSPPIVEIVRC
jgi:hypothetical protein